MLGFAYIDVPVYVVNEKCLFFFQIAFFFRELCTGKNIYIRGSVVLYVEMFITWNDWCPKVIVYVCPDIRLRKLA